jgi:hypothetical protein
MPRDNLEGSSKTMRERGSPLALSPNLIGSKDPHALKIPAREGGMKASSGELVSRLAGSAGSLNEESVKLAARGIKGPLLLL